MRHLRMVGLSLVAVFAITAIAATSASALPEWGKCEKLGTKTGAYSDANCTVKAKPTLTGEYKWVKGKELAPVKFSGESVGGGGVLTSTLRHCSGGKYDEKRVPPKKCEEGGGIVEEFFKGEPIAIECEKENNTGEATGTNLLANVHVTFVGCQLFGSSPCHGLGLPEGTIKTNELKGKLGYINKSKKEAGVVLEPAKKHGHFADFYCSGIELNTAVGVGSATEGAFYTPENTGGYDGVISPITPVNTMTSEYTQVYTVNLATNENIPSKFEGKHIELLEDYIYNPEKPEEFSFMWTSAGEEITNVNKSAEPGEIKA